MHGKNLEKQNSFGRIWQKLESIICILGCIFISQHIDTSVTVRQILKS